MIKSRSICDYCIHVKAAGEGQCKWLEFCDDYTMFTGKLVAQKNIKEAKPSTSTNTCMDAISAIEGALKIVDLWLPKTATAECECEVKALHTMHNNFIKIVQKQHHA